MMRLTDKAVDDLARTATGMGKVVEAHTDAHNVVCKVVVELPEWVKNPEVAERVACLWQERGFVASINKQGLLVVDGYRGNA